MPDRAGFRCCSVRQLLAPFLSLGLRECPCRVTAVVLTHLYLVLLFRSLPLVGFSALQSCFICFCSISRPLHWHQLPRWPQITPDLLWLFHLNFICNCSWCFAPLLILNSSSMVLNSIFKTVNFLIIESTTQTYIKFLFSCGIVYHMSVCAHMCVDALICEYMHMCVHMRIRW